MNLSPVLSALPHASASRALPRVREIGKANSSGSLDGECTGEDGPMPGAHGACRGGQASRNGTAPGVPLWNGPRLRPAFVAQVLGQVMMDPKDRALGLAGLAYRSPSAQIAHGSFFAAEI